MIKSDRWHVIYNSPSVTEWARKLSFTAGQYDRCLLVVNGLATGGSYEVSVNSCLSGVWRDSYNFIWTLTQSGSNVSGTVDTRSCGVYSVTGTLTGSDVVLNATGACCDFVYRGTVVDCASASGDWTNDCGGSGTWNMTKIDASEALDILEGEAEEIADDPSTMRT